MLVELSHIIDPTTKTYPGLPSPRIESHQNRAQGSYAPGTSFEIASYALVGNTGTYLDAPFHRFADGDDLAALALDRIANLEGIVIPTASKAISRSELEGRELADKAVLIRTGWAARWASDAYFHDYPFLTRDAAELLVDQKAALVGIDSLNVDDNRDPERPVHTSVLRAGIPIVEHLCGLEDLPADGFRFFAVPPRLGRGTSFPVRAFAIV